MSGARRSRKPAGDRKAEILEAAQRLAFEVGPDQVTTSMIAGELGLTQPSIYKHFPSKEAIWEQIATALTARIRRNLDRCRAAGGTPDDRLRMQVMDHLRLLDRTPALPEIMALRDLHKPRAPLRDALRQSMTAFHALVVQNVRSAQDHGIFRRNIDAADAATLILGTIQSLVFRMVLSRDTAILLRDGERLLNLQLSGFSRNGE